MKIIRQTALWSVLAAVLIAAVAMLFVSGKAAAGGLLGVGVANLEIGSMGLLGWLLLGQPAGPKVIQFAVLFGLLKLPLLVLLVFLATKLGMLSLDFFFAGFALVYFRLVHVALRDSRTEKLDQFS